MTGADGLLRAARTILLVDWPSREVPETLVRAGFTVFVKGGPEPDDYGLRELRDGQIVDRRVGAPPEHADLIYAHRPVAELPGIVALAAQVGATAVWYQSGLDSTGAKNPHGVWLSEPDTQEASTVVEAAGLVFVHAPYIVDAARLLEH